MNEFISLLFIAMILILLDAVWFSSYALENIYKPTFVSIQKSPFEPRIAGGLLAWFLIAIGIKYFVVDSPAIKQSPIKTFFKGALLGFIIYGVYNGTTYATFTEYPFNVASADTLWGAFAVGATSVVAGVYL